jgi:hypothetical protein
MTFTGMSAADKHAIGALFKSLKDEAWLDPTTAHGTDYANVWRIFFP